MAEGEDERSPAVMVIEAHEELVQHMEDGERKIRTLSIITVVVAFLLAASYFSQILLPLVSPTQSVQVNLADPALISVEVLLLILSAAWLYVGVRNYLFSTRLGRQIREVRAEERKIEKRITG